MKPLKYAALTLGIAMLLLNGCGETPFDTQEDKGPMVVLFHLQGPMTQFDDAGAMFVQPGLSQHALLSRLKKAADDILVQEIIIHVGPVEAGWARSGEISAAIRKAAKNKPVTCF